MKFSPSLDCNPRTARLPDARVTHHPPRAVRTDVHTNSAFHQQQQSWQRQRQQQRQRHQQQRHTLAAARQDTVHRPDPVTADEAAELDRQLEEVRKQYGQREDTGADVASPPADPSGKLKGKRIAVLQASKSDAVDVTEQQRSLGEYMTLPASQYSVLDAKRIERIDDDTFRCYVGGISFLGFKVEPVLTVSVVVGELGPTVSLLETTLEGSRAVQAVNDRFTATMTNRVRWRDVEQQSRSRVAAAADAAAEATGSTQHGSAPDANPDSGKLRQITSDTEIQVTLEVPGWLRFVSEDSIGRTGSKVMSKVLSSAVPRFLKQLRADYDLWASGDDSRKPVGDAELTDAA